MTRFSKIAALALAILAFAIGVVSYRHLQRPPTPPEISGAVYPIPRPAAEVSLLRQDGTSFVPATDIRHWSLAYFGYSYCPDVCPITMAVLAAAADRLAAELPGTRLDYLFISVDPERDTPERLSTYVPYFRADFVGITGDLVAINRLATSFGVVYLPPPTNAGQDYSVDHSDSLYLLQPGKGLRAVFRPPHDSTRLAAEVAAVVRVYGD